MITIVVPSKNTGEKYPPCTKCFKCEFPMKENKCGKFGEVKEVAQGKDSVRRD